MKHILLLLLTICSTSSLTSQDFQVSNIITFQGQHNSHEAYHSDAMGNYFIAGQGTGDIDFDFSEDTNSLPSTSIRDLYLAKYDAEGNHEWLLSFDGTVITNQIRAMVSDDAGNIYIAGSFSGRLNLTDDGLNEITSFGTSSMFVAKFDINGNLDWQFTVGDTNFSQYPDELFISNNRLIVQFVYAGTFDVDPGPETTELSGNSSAMLVYNLDGTFIEANSHAGKTDIKASAIDSDGNLYLSGSYGGLVSFDYQSNASVISIGIRDAFLAKYDPDFNLIWVKMINKALKNLRFTQFDFDSNNDLVASGYFAADTEIGPFTTSSDAHHLVNISKDGDFQNILEILPESCFITDLFLNSKNQIILNSTFNEVVDLDPNMATVDITPIEDMSNFLFAVYEPDFGLIGYDQINANTINTHSIHLNDSDRFIVLTDFEGQGKVVYGTPGSVFAIGDENFMYYELDIEGCSSTMEDYYLEGCNEVIINDEVYTLSGQYQQVLINAEGCDSTLNLTIEIYPEEQTNLMYESCGPFDLNGFIITESGLYALFLFTTNGCDSLVEIDLEIVDINKGVSLNEASLKSLEEEADSLQWYDCNTQMPVEGATEKIFMPEEDGSYQVEISKKFCVELSDCIDFVLSSTNNIDFEVFIAPNPTSGWITIDVPNNSEDIWASVYDIPGREVMQPIKMNAQKTLDLSSMPKGINLIKLENKSGLTTFKKIVIY